MTNLNPGTSMPCDFYVASGRGSPFHSLGLIDAHAVFIDEIAATGKVVIEENRLLIERLALTRKHFENWFLLEVYRRLLSSQSVEQLEVQRPFPTAPTPQRCDLWAQDRAGTEWWVELKVCATNYGSTSPRAITQVISSVIEDTKKLRSLAPQEAQRYILLVAYPLPPEYASYAPWSSHLVRIADTQGVISEAFVLPLSINARQWNLVAYQIKL